MFRGEWRTQPGACPVRNCEVSASISFPITTATTTTTPGWRKLKDLKLDVPPPAKSNKFPTRTLGDFVEADMEKKIGRRRNDYTDTEKQVITDVISRQEPNAIVVQSKVSYETSECATSEAYSMKTYQSITSLATSPANSSYSLYSNGYVLTTPESVQDNARSQSIHNLSYLTTQQQPYAPAPANGLQHMRHSFSSESDSRNRLDLDQALEALQRQQLHMHTKSPSSPQGVYIIHYGHHQEASDRN
ncbi:uncharacterized protein Dana_GF22783 [Drosophila ananassae]|uniref:Uncharacterized protein n=1 Tax=Drosophila ananassae TaxID=7217 RepID=B3N265_DROAN|nr:uncharacterized protein Dana_GF22783 [Drosophila ananassae]